MAEAPPPIWKASRLLRVAAAAWVLVVLAPLANAALAAATDPSLPFLGRAHGWVHMERPFDVSSRLQGERLIYVRQFSIDTPGARASVRVHGFTQTDVFLDGEELASIDQTDRWRDGVEVDLPSTLAPGQHELGIVVENPMGPALLRVSAEGVPLDTPEGWVVSTDSVHATAAVVLSDARTPPTMTDAFPTTASAVLKVGPWLALLFLVVLGTRAWIARSEAMAERARAWVTPSRLRWGLLVAWAMLAANNLPKLPRLIGFDVEGHYAYVDFILAEGHLPLAQDGWQMFQAPLFYGLAAGFKALVLPVLGPARSDLLLRVLPFSCGALVVELNYRAVRSVFPARQDLQRLGTLVGALLPVSLALSHSVGNEPLAGAATATAIVLVLGVLSQREGAPSLRACAAIGVALGLALLAKVSALVVFPSIFVALFFTLERAALPRAIATRRIAATALVVLAIAGWYYARNQLLLGRPFIGGWDQGRDIRWWQDPGFRSVDQLLSFGRAWVQPVFAGSGGLWDGLYSSLWFDGYLSGRTSVWTRPPWRYPPLIASVALSVVPAAALVVGLAQALRKRATAPLIFVTSCVVAWIIALVSFFVTVPVLAIAKSSYLVGLAPCFAVAVAAGMRVLRTNGIAAVLLDSLVVCWGVLVYVGFWVD